MNRNERRARARLQTNTAAALHKRAGRTGSAQQAVDVSQRLFQLGNIQEALPGLLRAAAAYPDDPGVRGALAYALASTGQVVPAIQHYRILLDSQPDTVAALTNLALLLIRTGNPDEARQHLQRAALLAPTHANTAFVLAELLGQQKRTDEAFREYRRAAVLFRQKIGPHPALQHCDDLVKLATKELAQIGLVDADQVEVGYVVRMPKAYPVYNAAYAANVETLRQWILANTPNVWPVGRNGMHKYNNQDHSMYTAMLSVENIVKGTHHDIWTVNVEQEYHEEKADKDPRAGTGRSAPIIG